MAIDNNAANRSMTFENFTPAPTHINDKKLDELPDEMLFEILSYLTPNDLARISGVNKKFYWHANDPLLWRGLYPLFVKYSVEKGVDPSINSKKGYKQFILDRGPERIAEVFDSFSPVIINSFFLNEDHFKAVVTPLIHDSLPKQYIGYRKMDFFDTSIFPEGKSIVIGKDQYEKPFISLKLKLTRYEYEVYETIENDLKGRTTENNFVITLFQNSHGGESWIHSASDSKTYIHWFREIYFPKPIRLASILNGAFSEKYQNLISLIQGGVIENTKNILLTDLRRTSKTNIHYLLPGKVKYQISLA